MNYRSNIVMTGVYPEQIMLGSYKGRVVVEKTKWRDGLTNITITVEAYHRGSYTLSVNTNCPLGRYLARFSAPNILIDFEDTIREQKFDEPAIGRNYTPAEMCEQVVKDWRNKVELLLTKIATEE